MKSSCLSLAFFLNPHRISAYVTLSDSFQYQMPFVNIDNITRWDQRKKNMSTLPKKYKYIFIKLIFGYEHIFSFINIYHVLRTNVYTNVHINFIKHICIDIYFLSTYFSWTYTGIYFHEYIFTFYDYSHFGYTKVFFFLNTTNKKQEKVLGIFRLGKGFN